MPSTTPGPEVKPPGGRHRVISSCLTCRRRKVRCDHVHPICGACTRGNHVCTYATDGAGAGNRVSKSSFAGNGKARGEDVQARLERLERLLEKRVNALGGPPLDAVRGDGVADGFSKQGPGTHHSPSNSQSSPQGMSSDNHDGTLLLNGEQTQFVSSLHYALLAEEVCTEYPFLRICEPKQSHERYDLHHPQIQDIKALLGSAEEERHDSPTQNNLINLLSLGRARLGQNLEQLLPTSQDHRDALLDIYFHNVDPMLHVTHKPTLIRKFSGYLDENHPMSFAVLYAAINSLPPSMVENRFGEKKEDLLSKYELGVEVGLARENYLTTASLEVFQAFIIWLTCITREEDMGA